MAYHQVKNRKGKHLINKASGASAQPERQKDGVILKVLMPGHQPPVQVKADTRKATVRTINSIIDRLSTPKRAGAIEATYVKTVESLKAAVGRHDADNKPYIMLVDPKKGEVIATTYQVIGEPEAQAPGESESVLDFSTQEYDRVWQKVMKQLDE